VLFRQKKEIILLFSFSQPSFGQTAEWIEQTINTSVWLKGVHFADEDTGSDQISFNLIVEPSAEFGVRLGKNFRFLVKGGLILMPPIVQDEKMFDNYVLYDGTVNSPEEYRRYALQGYDVELNPVAYDLRVGFALNFN